ncbi:hypothetical protein ACN47E_007374 [Coniothyrium glycines]
MAITPATFWSHGSPLLCSKKSSSSGCWAQFGKDALANKIKAVVFIGAHWEEVGDRIRVATKVHPGKAQMDMVPREYWENYQINVDVDLARRIIGLLHDAGFPDVGEDSTFDWHDDTITPARWMFPEETPPATVVGRKPASWAIEFEKSVSDVIAHNKGANLAGAMVRLTQNPRYKDAHPTDDHFYPLLVIAGALVDDEIYGVKRAQTWELQHMCNNQYVWGNWGP